jgi:hypothetical protein
MQATLATTQWLDFQAVRLASIQKKLSKELQKYDRAYHGEWASKSKPVSASRNSKVGQRSNNGKNKFLPYVKHACLYVVAHQLLLMKFALRRVPCACDGSWMKYKPCG